MTINMPCKEDLYIYGQIVARNTALFEHLTENMDLRGGNSPVVVQLARLIRGMQRFFRRECISDPIQRVAFRIAVLEPQMTALLPSENKEDWISNVVHPLLSYVNFADLSGRKIDYKRKHINNWRIGPEIVPSKKELKRNAILLPELFQGDVLIFPGYLSQTLKKPHKKRYHASKVKKLLKQYISKLPPDALKQKGMGYIRQENDTLVYEHNDNKAYQPDDSLRVLWRQP